MPSSWENISVDGQEMNIHLGTPSGSGPSAAVVVIHHASGVDPFTRSIVDRLASAGYVALAPNLYHRLPGGTPTQGLTPTEILNDPEVVADVNAAVDYLRSQSNVETESIGITGFCMGGRVVYLAAASNPHLRAAVPYYGGNTMITWGKATQSPFELSSQINCPIMFHFGEEDENPSQADMAKLDGELTRLGKAHQFYTYPGANHGFMNHTGQRYHQAASEASWPRTLEFFATHLKQVTVR
jgi:carboxymethylenebutenolidase